MQYPVSSTKEYLETLVDDWRKSVLMKLRDILLQQGLTEAIEYKMLAFRDQGKTIFHLNAQKNYVSLYVGDTTKIDTSAELLAGLDTGKGCIRFKNQKDLSQSRIDEFIKETIKIHRSGGDVGC
ncbi:MAG: DUF1801 domain-containing protein [Bacteroidota bacterium]